MERILSNSMDELRAPPPERFSLGAAAWLVEDMFPPKCFTNGREAAYSTANVSCAHPHFLIRP